MHILQVNTRKSIRLLIFLFIVSSISAKPNGCHVYGKIKFVEFGEDYKVKFVDFGEDLKIKYVSFGANDAGKWQIVDFGQDYKIRVVDFGEDIKVKVVSFGEGCESSGSSSSSGSTFTGWTFGEVIANSAAKAKERELAKEALEQQERIALSQMTPEQRDAYYRMKERDRRIVEKEAQDNFNAWMFCCGCIAIYGLIMDLADISY